MPSLVNINSISPQLRDVLLGLNLRPSPTITNNNYTQFLNGVGYPFTVAYGNPVLAGVSLQTTGLVWRPFNYTLNKYEGSTNPLDEHSYKDAGVVIGSTPNLPYSAGTGLYGLNTLTSQASLIYNNSTPQYWNNNPYDSIKNGNNPYDFSIGKNTFTDISSDTNNYGKKIKNSAGDLFSPNSQLNLYSGKKEDIVYAGDGLYSIPNVQNQKDNYLDENGNLNLGGPSTEPYNIISSLVKGGLGFNKSGSNGYSLVSNNDVRNSIVGRTLAATGLISDTNLGLIGAQRLAISLANNSLLKLQRDTIGNVNLNVFSWIDGKKDDFIKPNYEITVRASALGKTLDFLGDLAGFTRPKSQMKTEFFSFDERFTPTLVGNIARANGMLEATGKGQVIALFRNIQASLLNSNPMRQGYAPGLVSKRVDGEDGITHNVYAYGDRDGEILENTTYGKGNGNGRWTSSSESGFEADYFEYITDGNAGNTGNGSSPTPSDFIWADETINVDENAANTLMADADEIFGSSPAADDGARQPNRKSILYKTKELFKSGKIATLVNGHLTFDEISQIQSSVLSNGMMSKGNAALTSYMLSGKAAQDTEVDRTNVYCRTWTPMDKYDQIADLVRHKSLDKGTTTYGRNKHLSEFSILEDTGFPKIARYVSDTGTVKRHMFSIENLAWKGNFDFKKGVDLGVCEEGPYGGRIMWFPPYDIKFSESTSVNWDKHNFIGRGEPMYTYNNTERTGQLSFKVIIDHPDVLNKQTDNKIFGKTEYDENAHYASFFAGCNTPDLKAPTGNQTQKPIPPATIPPQQKKVVPEPPSFNVFFPNDNYTYPYKNAWYESGIFGEPGKDNVIGIYEVKIAGKSKNPNINKYLTPYDYNLILGRKDDDGYPTAGPMSPIGLSANDYSLYKLDYINKPESFSGTAAGMVYIENEKIVSSVTEYYVDRNNYGLNANRHDADTYNLTIPGNPKYDGVTWGGWLAASDMYDEVNESYLIALKNHLDYKTGPCKYCVVKIYGYASKQCVGRTAEQCKKKNQKLSDKRAATVLKFLKENVFDPSDPNLSDRILSVVGKGQEDYWNRYVEKDEICTADGDQDALGCKMNRRVRVTFEYSAALEQKAAAPPTVVTQTIPTTITSNNPPSNGVRRYYAECDYFGKLSVNDPFTFKKINDKIKFFSPAFHSTTPEGFNARLTFLQQCTRQGPSLYTNSSKPDNLVFGRPPVCVLRIGDFYYTKIVIESLSIDYEPLVWDLNPEGVGVQPMIANVSMNFAFIGGSSLDGPIAKLQNALAFNYYANTGLFVGELADNNNANYDTNNLDATDTDPNDIYENSDQTTGTSFTSTATTAQNIDYDILDNGVLTISYDDSGIFQGKVKGTFTIDSTLSKQYTIKIRTKLCEDCKKTARMGGLPTPLLDDEPIATKNMLLNETKIDFSTKTKTTNSLQAWSYYFTDTQSSFNIYGDAQDSLNRYVELNTEESGDNRDKGWKFDTSLYLDKYNYDFVVEVDELKFKKEYRASWVPIFKSKVLTSEKQDPEPDEVTGEITTTYTYTYQVYLSGGKLNMLNSDNKTTDEVEKEIKAASKLKKEEDKRIAKTKKDNAKNQKKLDKAFKELQKAKIAKGNGSLL